MSEVITPNELKTVLDALAVDLEAVKIRVPESRYPRGERLRASLLADIRIYFDDRLAAPGAPIVVAVMGPSGVGVSSVVNALVGEPASPTGVLRPTTRAPVLCAPHGASGRWWDAVRGRYASGDELDVVVGGPDTAAREWVVVDVPAAVGPSESIELAARADLCVFVSSPSRYADAEAAAIAVDLFERGVPTWFVMNKLPEEPVLRFEMVEAYAGLLHSWDLIERPSPDLIETAARTANGTVVRGDLGRLRSLLNALAADADREALFADAIAARLSAVGLRAEEVAERVEDDRDTLLDLRAASVEAYAAIADDLAADLEEGTLAGLAEHPTWLEAAVDLAGILTRRAGLAAGRTTREWETTAAGEAVLAEGGGALRRHGEQAAFESQGLLEAWYAELGDRAGAAARRRATRRRKARIAADLWPLVLDRDRVAPRRLARRVGPVLNELTIAGRTRLAETMRAALERDRARFDAFLGPAPDVARLGRIITAASRLASVAVTGFGSSAFTWEHDSSGSSPDLEPEATTHAGVAEPPARGDEGETPFPHPVVGTASIPESPVFELPEVPDAPPEAPATAFAPDRIDDAPDLDAADDPGSPDGDDRA